MPTPSTYTVRQLSPQERARLDSEAESVAAECLAGSASADRPPTSGNRIVDAARSVARATASAARRVRAAFTRDNLDVALNKSAGFAKLVAKYGADAAKEAVLRRVRRAVEDKVGGAIAGHK